MYNQNHLSNHLPLYQGNVFEKRVLLSLLTTNGGTCPITKAPLTEDDLIDIVPAPRSTVPAAPTSVSGAGFGGLLASMQTEWDALMVETFNLKSALEETRRELSQALYQNDAAVRVIARLTMERDQARQVRERGRWSRTASQRDTRNRTLARGHTQWHALHH